MKKQVCAVLTAAIVLFTSTAALADTGTVTASVLNVREAPGAGVIGQLFYGENVTVVGYESGWCRILMGDKTGYIYGNYVSVTPDEAAETAAATMGDAVLEYAKSFLGVPYVYGGSSPYGFDCSGFTKYVYANFGVSLPRTSYSQMYSGTPVSIEDMQIGDLIVFRGGGHVGIYAGNGTYIHAPQTGRSVSVDPLNRPISTVRRLF